MPPKKRKATQANTANDSDRANPPKRISKAEQEKLICKKKLDALALEESLTTEDRLNAKEREQLLQGYNQYGFQIFQDTKLLHQFLQNRRESDLKGLVQRLKTGLQSAPQVQEETTNEWLKLCQNLMGNFARDKRVNLDDALADALLLVADERERIDRIKLQHPDDNLQNDNVSDKTEKPNYPELLRSFAQLLSGRFPDNMTPTNARISMKLFDHINGVVDRLYPLASFASIEDGSWIENATLERRRRQEMAQKGLEDLSRLPKESITCRDLERNRNIEALSLELPKIKRISEIFNPLNINDSLMSTLINRL